MSSIPRLTTAAQTTVRREQSVEAQSRLHQLQGVTAVDVVAALNAKQLYAIDASIAIPDRTPAQSYRNEIVPDMRTLLLGAMSVGVENLINSVDTTALDPDSPGTSWTRTVLAFGALMLHEPWIDSKETESDFAERHFGLSREKFSKAKAASLVCLDLHFKNEVPAGMLPPTVTQAYTLHTLSRKAQCCPALIWSMVTERKGSLRKLSRETSLQALVQEIESYKAQMQSPQSPQPPGSHPLVTNTEQEALEMKLAEEVQDEDEDDLPAQPQPTVEVEPIPAPAAEATDVGVPEVSLVEDASVSVGTGVVTTFFDDLADDDIANEPLSDIDGHDDAGADSSVVTSPAADSGTHHRTRYVASTYQPAAQAQSAAAQPAKRLRTLSGSSAEGELSVPRKRARPSDRDQQHMVSAASSDQEDIDLEDVVSEVGLIDAIPEFLKAAIKFAESRQLEYLFMAGRDPYLIPKPTAGAIEPDLGLDPFTDRGVPMTDAQRSKLEQACLARIADELDHPGERRRGLPRILRDTRDPCLEKDWYCWRVTDVVFLNGLSKMAVALKAKTYTICVHDGMGPDNNWVTDISHDNWLAKPDFLEVQCRQLVPYKVPSPEKPSLVFVNPLWGTLGSFPSMAMLTVAVRKAMATIRAFPNVTVLVLVPTPLNTDWFDECASVVRDMHIFAHGLDFMPAPGSSAKNWRPNFLDKDRTMVLLQFSGRYNAAPLLFECFGTFPDFHGSSHHYTDQKTFDQAINRGIIAGAHAVLESIADETVNPWCADLTKVSATAKLSLNADVMTELGAPPRASKIHPESAKRNAALLKKGAAKAKAVRKSRGRLGWLRARKTVPLAATEVETEVVTISDSGDVEHQIREDFAKHKKVLTRAAQVFAPAQAAYNHKGGYAWEVNQVKKAAAHHAASKAPSGAPDPAYMQDVDAGDANHDESEDEHDADTYGLKAARHNRQDTSSEYQPSPNRAAASTSRSRSKIVASTSRTSAVTDSAGPTQRNTFSSA
ncbi:hypothetical protein RI367_006644 [Sorochytrium milnesiophthora]